jgi:transposase
VGWHTIMRAVFDHGTPLVADPARTAAVRALGVDETSFLGAGPQRRARFVTGLVDLDRRRLLDVVDGRADSAVTGWLEARAEPWLSGGGARGPGPLPRLLQRHRGRLGRA